MISFKVFIRNKEKSGATQKYIETIGSALSKVKDATVSHINSLSDLKENDIVIIISLQTYFRLLLKKPHQKFIFWSQGITPEEVKMLDNSLYGRIKVSLFTLLEKRILDGSIMNIFVSKAMHKHYEIKYNYLKKNYVVIPCSNMDLQTESFDYSNKYKKATFVYAGNASQWQCLEETILLFTYIKKDIPNALFTIFTSDQEVVKKMLKKYQVEATVDFVHVSQLNQELTKFKYGFLLRKECDVNRVATPTKLNSYVANGVIPIYSNVIEDFKAQLSKTQYALAVDIDHLKEGAKIIAQFNSQEIRTDQIRNQYIELFDNYYNIKKYQTELINKVSSLLYQQSQKR